MAEGTETRMSVDDFGRVDDPIEPVQPAAKCPNCFHRAHYALRCGATIFTGGEGEFDIPIRCECLDWGQTAMTGEMARANNFAEGIAMPPMSDQPKKQELPPLDERYVELTADLDGSEDIDADVRVRLALDCREDQLRTALSDNEALRADNEAKDARIAELEADKKALKTADELNRQECSHWVSRYNNALHRAAAAEAKLKSVEGMLEEKPERWYSSMHNGFAYTHISVDALLASIREAVK